MITKIDNSQVKLSTVSTRQLHPVATTSPEDHNKLRRNRNRNHRSHHNNNNNNNKAQFECSRLLRAATTAEEEEEDLLDLHRKPTTSTRTA